MNAPPRAPRIPASVRLWAMSLIAAAAPAQVQVSVSVVPNQAAKRMLNKRAASIASPWVGTARNAGTERVLLAESAIISQMARYQPLDRSAMLLLIQDAQQYSLLARLARGGQDLTALGAFVAAGRSLVAPWPEALAGVAWGAPYLVGRVRGLERPVGASFEALSAGWPVSIEPGATVGFHVFTARRNDQEPPAVFTLGVGGPVVRMVQ